eukprot:363378-Chlamydomonas_euryale.AAC.22
MRQLSGWVSSFQSPRTRHSTYARHPGSRRLPHLMQEHVCVWSVYGRSFRMREPLSITIHPSPFITKSPCSGHGSAARAAWYRCMVSTHACSGPLQYPDKVDMGFFKGAVGGWAGGEAALWQFREEIKNVSARACKGNTFPIPLSRAS